MKTTEQFLVDLKKSYAPVHAVAEHLEVEGFTVEVPVPVIRPDASVRMDYHDDGDIIVKRKGDQIINRRAEVKRVNISFTEFSDHPFPRVFIDEVYKVERRSLGTLFAYYIVNREMTHAAVIYPNTKWLWKTVTCYDRFQGRDASIYAICAEWVAWWVPLKRKGSTDAKT